MTTADPHVLPLDVAMKSAVDHHLAGRLREADEFDLGVFQAQPDHADANHNPGQGLFALSYAETLLTTDQPEAALTVIEATIERGFNNPEAESLREKADVAAKLAVEVAARSDRMKEGSGALEKSVPAPAEFGRVVIQDGHRGKRRGQALQ